MEGGVYFVNKNDLLGKVASAVVNMEEELAAELCSQSIAESIPANETINSGLVAGMNEVSRLYEEEEYFEIGRAHV